MANRSPADTAPSKTDVTIRPPLGLGTVELSDGRQVVGFLCEPHAVSPAKDVTAYGSWPTYLAERPD